MFKCSFFVGFGLLECFNAKLKVILFVFFSISTKKTYSGIDVWLCNRRNGRVYAVDSRFSPQNKFENCRTSTIRRILVGPSRFKITGKNTFQSKFRPENSNSQSIFIWCKTKLFKDYLLLLIQQWCKQCSDTNSIFH